MARIILSDLYTADAAGSVEDLSASQLSVLVGGTDIPPVVEEPSTTDCLPPAPPYTPPPSPYVPRIKFQKW